MKRAIASAVRGFIHRFARARPWGPEIALCAVALALSLAALRGEPLPLDAPLSQAIHSWQFPLLHPVLWTVSEIGRFHIAAPVTAGVVIALAAIGWRRQALTLGGAALTGQGLSHLLKALIARPRPELAADQFAALGAESYAFPSGHALSSAIFYGFFAYLLWRRVHRPWPRRLGVGVMLVMIALVGLSRVYLGVHWPSDVAGGYAIGILWLLLWTRAQRAWSASGQGGEPQGHAQTRSRART